MRIFALSDVHADFEPNARWLRNLSLQDYQSDVLILAGDVSDSLPLLGWCLELVARRFQKVLFVPGNHELWTLRERPRIDSFEKFERVQEVARNSGGSMETFRTNRLSIVPLLAWYDYSFGTPSTELKHLWMDFHACVWPPECDVREITARFLALNEAALDEAALNGAALNGAALDGAALNGAALNGAALSEAVLGEAALGDGPTLVESADGAGRPTVVSFSHFLPRLELVPKRGAASALDLSPVLGSASLDRQVRQARSTIHVYGHSHVNRRLGIDAVTYVNNAFGYPHESAIAAKRLLCVFEH